MFSEQERQRRLDGARKLIRDNDLKAIYLLGNSTVGTNAFGCFRYFVDSRIIFFLMSVVILPEGEPVAVVNNTMGKLNLVGRSFIREAEINLDQLGGVISILKSHGITSGKLGVLLEVMPASWMLRLKKELPGLELVDVSEQIFALRAEKSPEEAEAQRIGGKVAEAGYEALCRELRPGMYENEAVAIIDRAMQRLGSEESFNLITSGRFSAKDNAMPTLHNTASINRRIEKGDCVALEITPRYNGYWTQMARTVCVGEPNPEAEEFHAIIVGAIAAATAMMRPGVPVGEMVRVMREYVESRGYTFAMPCGHIAAVDLNEERTFEGNPRLLNEGMMVILHPTVLKEGMTSGIYWGESYLVTADGCEPVMPGSQTLCVTAAD